MKLFNPTWQYIKVYPHPVSLVFPWRTSFSNSKFSAEQRREHVHSTFRNVHLPPRMGYFNLWFSSIVGSKDFGKMFTQLQLWPPLSYPLERFPTTRSSDTCPSSQVIFTRTKIGDIIQIFFTTLMPFPFLVTFWYFLWTTLTMWSHQHENIT